MRDIKQKIKVLLAGVLAAVMTVSCAGKGGEDALEEYQPDQAGPVESLEPEKDEAGEKGTDRSGEDCNPEEEIYVFVCGQVASPGVYKLLADSRIYQAIEAAGGLLETAAGDYVNQAGRLEDGQQIYVPAVDEVQSGGSMGGTEGSSSLPGAALEDGRVNINTASKEELMTLTGIGERKAEAILKYRDTNGGFQNVEDLMNVEGIKAGTFEKIKEDIVI